MKCAKDTVITIGLLLTVILTIGGIGLDQVSLVRAEQEKQETRIAKDIDSIKDDIREIRADIKELLKK